MSGKIDRAESLIGSISKWLNWIGGFSLVAMLAIIVADVIGVKLFKSPVPGAPEFTSLMGLIVIAFATAYTLFLKGHIQVEFLVMRLPLRGQTISKVLVSLFGLALFVLLSWHSYEYGSMLQSTGEVSMTQRIPLYPFAYAIAFCSIPVCLVLIVDIIKTVMKAGKK